MNTILRLFYDLSIYRHILEKPFHHSLLRFLLIYLILSIGYSYNFSNEFLQTYATPTNDSIQQISQQIPDDSSFVLQNHTLTTQGVTLPLTIPPLSIHDTHFTLIAPNQNQEQIKYQDLELTDTQFTGKDLKNYLNQSFQLFNTIKPYLFLVISLPVYLGLIIIRLPNVLFFSLLFLLGIKISNSDYRFNQIVKLSLNSILVAETLSLAILIIYGSLHQTIFSIAFIGISILAYLNLPAKQKLQL